MIIEFQILTVKIATNIYNGYWIYAKKILILKYQRK